MQSERRRRIALTAALAGALVGACDRKHRESPSAPLPAPAKSEPAAQPKACTLTPIATKLPAAKRLVGIGDLHGDIVGTRAALLAAKVIDASDKWIGGDTVVVQTGDILDRGDDEDDIYLLLERLDGEARKAGGAIVLLNGNHELMNVARDYRYVMPSAMADFGGDRQKAFDPGGPWAKRLAHYNIVAIVNDTVFSHAGVLLDWVTQIDDINLGSRCWLDGQAGGPADPPLALASDSSPVWTRAYGMPEAIDCAQLADALTKLGAKRMVVGHTVQEKGITSACDGALWRIDVGLAGLYGGPIEVLELSEPPRVLRGSR
ncbi:MAG TPA: metallophosphoesterase [Kofleriaceae bacterium]